MESTNNLPIVYACICSGKKILAASGCLDDRAAVAIMPASWVPRHAGPILTNYLEQQEQDHQTILQEISKHAAKVNAEIDASVRVLAENLQSSIEQNQTTINCIITSYNDVETDNPPKSPLTVESRDEELENINQLIYQRVQEIGKFKRDAIAWERKRGDRLRMVLSDNFHRLVAVGNQTPKVLLHYFDERVYEANQQLLSNCRAYTELEARLRAQTDASAVRARASLNQLCLGVRMSIRKRSSQRSTRRASANRTSFSASDTEHRESLVPSIKSILNGAEELDECEGLIVEAYKNGLHKIYKGFSLKLIDLREGLGTRNREISISNLFETSELRQVIEKNLRRLANCVNSKTSRSKNAAMSMYSDAVKLQMSMANLVGHLRTTYDILNDAGHLWDAHIMRSALAQKLTMAAVEDLLTSNDSIELANEILFGINLEQLRTSPDPDKLKQFFQDLQCLIDKTASLYHSHSKAEVERLEEFLNLPTALADTLLAEFQCFLELHPREQPDLSGSTLAEKASGVLTPQRESVTVSHPLPRVLLQSELHCKALQNWMNGFLESFQSNVSSVPNDLKCQARSWVDEKIAMINVRYSMKMMSHSIRLERVKVAREARLAELSFHEARLASHLEAIFQLIDTLAIEASNFLSIDAPSLYPFCYWMARLQASLENMQEREPLDPETKRLIMSSYPPRLMKHRVLFEESLDEAVEFYKMSIEQQLHAARIVNLRFICALKLFGEGGSYSTQEALKTSAALVKAADALEAGVPKIHECLHQRRHQLLTMADNLLATFSGVPKVNTRSPTNVTSSKKLKKK